MTTLEPITGINTPSHIKPDDKYERITNPYYVMERGGDHIGSFTTLEEAEIFRDIHNDWVNSCKTGLGLTLKPAIIVFRERVLLNYYGSLYTTLNTVVG